LGNRYITHAGQNLPVKEFRYLWTVMVTAAIYRMTLTERGTPFPLGG